MHTEEDGAWIRDLTYLHVINNNPYNGLNSLQVVHRGRGMRFNFDFYLGQVRSSYRHINLPSQKHESWGAWGPCWFSLAEAANLAKQSRPFTLAILMWWSSIRFGVRRAIDMRQSGPSSYAISTSDLLMFDTLLPSSRRSWSEINQSSGPGIVPHSQGTFNYKTHLNIRYGQSAQKSLQNQAETFGSPFLFIRSKTVKSMADCHGQCQQALRLAGHLKVPRALLTFLSCKNRLNVGVTHIRMKMTDPRGS